MVTQLFLLFCFVFATREADGQCHVGDQTFQAGEAWKEEWECVGHYCLEDGTYNTTTCPPVSKDVPEGWTLKPEDPEAFSFPYCCAQVYKNPDSPFNYSLPGCTVDNTTFKVGEQHDEPGSCHYKSCKGNDEWIVGSCGIFGAPPGWEIVPDNTSKPYPDCCSHAVPPLNIVPDVLDKLHWAGFLGVTYGRDVKANIGNELTPIQTKDEPEVTFKGNPKGYYLLCLTDPDAPSRKDPKYREYLHWLVGNIPGSDISSGEVLAGYRGPSPPKDTGLHRYVFLLFRQPGKLLFDEPKIPQTSAENRARFSIRKFSEKYKLGDPKGFNLFQSQYIDSVPGAL